MFTVYKATHVPTGKAYVGRTGQGLQCRIGQHWGQIESKRKLFQHFLHSTKMEDWEWAIIAEVGTQKEARDCEMYHIRLWDLYSVGLNEKTGTSDRNKREAASKRMKEYRAANPDPWHKGRTGVYSEETLEKMRLAKLKNPTRIAYTGEMKLAASLNAKNSKQVVELKSGMTFNSINNAAKHFSVPRQSVRDVAKGKRSHVAGYVFEFINKGQDVVLRP